MRLIHITFLVSIAVTSAFTSTSSKGRLLGWKPIKSRSKLGCQDVKPCFYEAPDGEWKKRIQLKDLVTGQLLIGKKISSSDLLEAKTGPKVFFECGVGRIDTKGNWQIVNSMLRLGKSYSKPSVIRKKAGRLSGKPMNLYVHKVCLDTCRLEVKLNLEDVQTEIDKNDVKVPASSLRPGEELIGKVVQVRPYGCIIDVGANRNGLLHIQKVADLFRKYIDKEVGLEEAGLEKGATVRVTIESNERKRMFLDFTDETKALAAEEEHQISVETERTSEKIKNEEEKVIGYEAEDEDGESTSNQYEQYGYDISADEAAAWAAYASSDFEDEYDEDADIEDALGIGSY